MTGAEAAAGVIRQTIEHTAQRFAQDLGEDARCPDVDEALELGVDTSIATALASAGYFDATLPDTDVAVKLEATTAQLDAFLGFATRLAEVAGVQPPSDLVDGVEDLVDEVLTKMLAEGGDES